MPLVQTMGYRVIAPWLRGFGQTSFKKEESPRTSNPVILAYDAIALMNKSGIQKFSVVGHDWGSNIAEVLAIGWPDRIDRLALLSLPPRLGGVKPSFDHAQLQWYHWFMATRLGAEAVRNNPIGFAHIMWDNWAPKGWFDEATFQKVAQSWLNPDFVDITLHSYRSRWKEAEPDAETAGLQNKIDATTTLALPVLYIQGEADGVNPPYVSANIHKKFTGYFKRILMPGVGHFPSREAPVVLAGFLIEFLNLKFD
jgi:pimeloyl-ACP methyl ester carboxylesterase